MKSFLRLSVKMIRTLFIALLGSNTRRAITTLVVAIGSEFGTKIDPEWLAGVLALVAAVFAGAAIQEKKTPPKPEPERPISPTLGFDRPFRGGN